MSTAMTAGMGHACATGVRSMLQHSWCCRNSQRPWIRAGAAGWSREAGMPLRCHTGTGQPAYLLWCSMGTAAADSADSRSPWAQALTWLLLCRLPLVASSRGWRRGVPTFITIDQPVTPELIASQPVMKVCRSCSIQPAGSTWQHPVLLRCRVHCVGSALSCHASAPRLLCQPCTVLSCCCKHLVCCSCPACQHLPFTLACRKAWTCTMRLMATARTLE